MISTLRGTLFSLNSDYAIIECNGVGYKVIITGSTLRSFAGKENKEVFAYTYLKISENDVELFGFSTEEEMNVFKMLISVSGVGPRTAVSILSTLSPEKLALAVATEDAKAISQSQGVGPKMAARIVLELKDKLAKAISTPTGAQTSDVSYVSVGEKMNDAVDALLVLGYKRAEITTVLRTIDVDNLELEETIKQALKKLTR